MYIISSPPLNKTMQQKLSPTFGSSRGGPGAL